MIGFWTMLKMNTKLLLRNKGYLCFLILLPLAATLLLNLTLAFNSSPMQLSIDNDAKIVYLDSREQRIDSLDGMNINVKVYDFSVSELSGYLLKYLQNIGIFQIYCLEDKGGTLRDAEKSALDTMNRNTVSSIIIIKNGGNFNENIEIYYGRDDIRIDILIKSVNDFIALYEKMGMDILSMTDLMPKLPSHEFNKDNTQLDAKMHMQRRSTMFSWGLVSMAFALSGVFVSNLLIMERNNGTLKRMRLSDVSMNGYFLVKILMALFTVIIQMVFMGIGIWFFVKVDFGITMIQYLMITFGFALILNILSLVIGILVNNLLTTSYIAFCAGSMLPLVSGLYFPGVTLRGWLSTVSMISPQRFSVIALDALIVGDESVYGNYILAVTAFLVILGCVGVLGLKGVSKETD